ncbi:MAG TPA: hypothetical protein VGH76_26405 [Actinomycetospora sp.]|uniref:oxidoreductase n=1 Tax=Actinomycetospora sp. TaxID=1872135 RepID=UPI002F4280B3
MFPEQIAIVPEGRTTVDCAGIWSDDQIEGHARVTGIIRRQGGVAGIQLDHTGRKGSEVAAHGQVGEYGPGAQLPPDPPAAGRPPARRTSPTAATTPSRWRARACVSVPWHGNTRTLRPAPVITSRVPDVGCACVSVLQGGNARTRPEAEGDACARCR